MPSTTAVRITTISAAQNKRGKDCFEGGMETGSFTWFKDMGGNSNWMYIKVVNVSSSTVSLALWLLYEASTEPLVDPLTGSGSIQVGFFNQSKNLNRQVPLFELAEESKPGLEIGAGQSSTLKVRINDLSSHHQNQRFIIVIGPADAPIRGSRSVPIEIMSKPRVDSDHPSTEEARLGAKRTLTSEEGADRGSAAPPLKRTMTETSHVTESPVPLLSALAAITDPAPSPERKIELILKLLEALDDPELVDLADKLIKRVADRGLDDKLPARPPSRAADDDLVQPAEPPPQSHTPPPQPPQQQQQPPPPPPPQATPSEDGADEPPSAKPRKLQPLVKAMLAFRKNAREAAAKNAGGGPPPPEMPPWVNSILDRFPNDENLNLSEDQLREFFVDDDSGLTFLEQYGSSLGNGAVHAAALAAATAGPAPAQRPPRALVLQPPLQPPQPLGSQGSS